MKQPLISRGYGLFIIIITILGAWASAPSAIAQFYPRHLAPPMMPQAPPVIEEEETTGYQPFPFAEVEAPPLEYSRPGYGPGERILFPPSCGRENVWTLLYLNQEKELCFAFPMSEGIWATGDWFRLRHTLVKQGVNIIGSYSSDIQGNVVGGKSQGFAYADNIDVRVDLDMQKLVGWPGAHLWFSFVDRNGRDLSQRNVGNVFTVAQLWTTETISYYALCLDQNFFNGRWNLKIGRLAAMDDFGSSPIYSYYVSGGINDQPLAFPECGFLSSYPATTWGSRLRFNDEKHNIYAMFGVYQTTRRLYMPAYHGVDFSMRRNDGLNFLWEIGWTPEFQPHPIPSSSRQNHKKIVSYPSPPTTEWHGMNGNYKIGVYYTPWRNIPQFDPTQNTFYSYGFYWLFDQMVYQAVPGTHRGITLWGAFIYSPQQNTSKFPFQGILGAVCTGLLPRRTSDQLLLALIGGNFSPDYAAREHVQGGGYPTYEMVVEASYRINLSSFFYIQPDIQYVIRPGGTGQIPHALVIGAQIGCNF